MKQTTYGALPCDPNKTLAECREPRQLNCAGRRDILAAAAIVEIGWGSGRVGLEVNRKYRKREAIQSFDRLWTLYNWP